MTTPMGVEMMLPEALDKGTPTLFWLEIGTNRLTSANADGSNPKTLGMGMMLQAPDGVTVDPEGKHLYVLNMGIASGGANTGSLVRYNLDGTGGEQIMKPGTKVGNDTFNTGKQVAIDRVNHKLYMGDREGSKVWRCDLDGKNLEVLVSDHMLKQVVGVGVDPTRNEFYFSDRNGKRVLKASMKMPDGKTPSSRDDVTVLYLDKAPNAMPLDIELNLKTRTIFWSDKEQGKIFSMAMDMPAGSNEMTRTDVKTVAQNLIQVIGLGYDHQQDVLYATSSGAVYTLKPDGSEAPKRIGMNGSTGIAFVRVP